MQTQVCHVVEKLQHLSPKRLAEADDFIDFIQLRDQSDSLRRDFALASEAAFAKIWDNDDDAIYDKL
ncbi:MAG: toxin-antitoxin system, antitoxin component, Xre family protein [Candidatus Methylumidiphilus alinenensis]|uniref:Toxin-antitoxin system, antitoxin component, Xre family protein n=1 Tax=Candidatus Methylumidiphilus alinenensis TaxID=2202197 RepID=A0A2W4RV71_9GAMM|nr:MAG: toxin-antitoxin system, antitoxin component, Xre family protein [Candidatus Methylumidiphilus alinenensis]